jgi:RNA polymerase sigma factor (sigma-70 family)
MPISKLNRVIHHVRTALAGQDGAQRLDGDLLERYVCQRDEAAFEALVRRHGPMVLGVCRRVLHNVHDVEDAFQATFLILVRKASTLRSPSMIGNWLYGVAYRTALHARNAAAKRRAKEAEMEPRTAPAEDTFGDLRLALDQELARLPDSYRAVVVLCDLEGKTRKQASRELGWAEGTVASRLVRGRALLAKRLRRHRLPLSVGVLAAALSSTVATASIPRSLVASTVRAAGAQAAAPGPISAAIAALAEGVLKTMMVTKLKTMTALLFVGGALALASALAATDRAPPTDQGDGAAKVASASGKDQASRRQGASERTVRDDALAKCLAAAEQVGVDVAKVKLLADLAFLKARAGNAAGAMKTLEMAVKLADAQKGTAEDRAGGLAQVAHAQARLGQRETAVRTFRRALEVTGSAEHPLVAPAGLYHVAKALILTGDTEWGWEVWDEALRNDPVARKTGSLLTTELAGLLTAAGDIRRARDALVALREDKTDVSAYGAAVAEIAIAEALLAKDDTTKAQEHLDAASARALGLPDLVGTALLLRPDALVKLAGAQARAGNKKGAVKSLEQVQAFLVADQRLSDDMPAYRKASCLAQLAVAWSAVGERDRSREPLRRARAIADAIQHPAFRRAALAEVALAHSRLGDWAEALATGRLLEGRNWREIEQLSEAGARAGKAEAVAEMAGALTDAILRGRAYLGLARGLTNEPDLPRGPLRKPGAAPKNGPPPTPPEAKLPAAKDLSAICSGMDATAAAWKKQTRWMFRYVYSGRTVDPAPGSLGPTPPNEMINARKGDWLAGREATFATEAAAGAAERLCRWHVWRDGKYTRGSAGGPTVTDDSPMQLGNFLFFATAFGLDNLPVPLLESAAKRYREDDPKLEPRERAARKIQLMGLLPHWFRENAENYRVRPELEPVDGHPCHVMEWTGRDVVWVDAAAGFSVRRRIIHHPSGEVASELSAWGFREMRPGMWIPPLMDARFYNDPDAPDRYRGKVAKTINITLLEARFGDDVPDDLFNVPAAP